ncbi:MAG: ATP-binding cassette domain-containing protein, partial [Acidaminococcaceae bacterium]|nr:ATP-binding cassette domain-containing protein [Acidaminococcaceae bacterium]
MVSDKVLLEVKHLQKSFGDKTIFKDLSLTVRQGEVIVLVGPSGCGKSTFLRCLNGLEEYEHGEVFLDGKEIAGYNDDELAHTRNAKIGFVFQNFNLLAKLTAQANVALPLVY